MDFIRYNKQTDERIVCNYPRSDNEPVKGLGKNTVYYELQRQPMPTYNPLQHSVEEKIKLTTKNGEFLKVAELSYMLKEFSQEQVIAKLNHSVGEEYLDIVYPPWERDKFQTQATELKLRGTLTAANIVDQPLNEAEEMRLEYIMGIKDWVARVRAHRDYLESEFFATGTLPTVEWEARIPKPDGL